MAATLSPLVTHLSTIKRRLFIIAATIGVWVIVAFAYSAELIAWFKRPFPDDLIFYGPAEALFASIKVSFLAGIVLSLPVILYQFWKFIEPALLPKEQKWGIPLFLLAAGFFVLGLIFCNLVILPLVIQFFVGFGMQRDVTPELAVGTYVDFNVKFLIVFGFAFEMPMALTLLSRAGLLTADILARYRKHAILAALILSAVITPDATMFTMLLMAIPLMVLYELGIVGARVFRRRVPPGESGGSSGEPDQEADPVGPAGRRIR